MSAETNRRTNRRSAEASNREKREEETSVRAFERAGRDDGDADEGPRRRANPARRPTGPRRRRARIEWIPFPADLFCSRAPPPSPSAAPLRVRRLRLAVRVPGLGLPERTRVPI